MKYLAVQKAAAKSDYREPDYTECEPYGHRNLLQHSHVAHDEDNVDNKHGDDGVSDDRNGCSDFKVRVRQTSDARQMQVQTMVSGQTGQKAVIAFVKMRTDATRQSMKQE